MRTIWLPANPRRPSDATPCVSAPRQARALAAHGEWLVPNEARPNGWEKLGLAEPMMNEERLSQIKTILTMDRSQLREC